MPITGAITLIASAENTFAIPPTNNNNRIGSVTDFVDDTYLVTDGVGVDQADLVWTDRITVVAGATNVIDLSPLAVDAAAQTDVYGNAIAYVEVTAIVIRNRETVAGTRTLNFGPGAANPYLWLFVDASDLVVIVPGGMYYMKSDEAQPVGAGGTDQLQIINTDGVNAVTYDIWLLGRSA